MSRTTVTTILASAAHTASGTAGIGAASDGDELIVYIDVTAVSGTGPSMTVTYQSSPDGVTFYSNTVGTAITAAGQQMIKVPNNVGKYGRISYAITGTTPSFTFSAVAESRLK